MDKLEELEKLEEKYHMHTYARYPVAFVKGEGKKLWDVDGHEYLDFLAGLGVSSVGHCHPKVVLAVKEQVEKLIHVSNLFYTEPQALLAEKLASLSFGDKCFFANSGAEANEGAVKLTRKYAKLNLGEEKYEIITAYRSFHGRTMKMLAATGQPEKQKPFEPLPPGFIHVPLNDLSALKAAISAKTGAVMLEPIQGEGGIYPCEFEYLRGVRELCDEHDLLLILDEVQTGFGRTGKMFAYEHFGIEPDIITLAKGLGGGLPVGAFIAKEKVAQAFEPGDHGTTFGGGPVVCSAALAVLDILDSESLIQNAALVGEYFKRGLKKLQKTQPLVADVRGKGLMLGVELDRELAWPVVQKMLEKSIVIGYVGKKILRFLPPLIVNESDVEGVLLSLTMTLEEVMGEVK